MAASTEREYLLDFLTLARPLKRHEVTRTDFFETLNT